MKYLVNFSLRLLVKIALHGYFKKIRVVGKENIPKNTPIILVANHQNALIDPLLLATHTNLNPHFLTRASVFKNPWIAKILNFIRMLPVYRVRDGFSTIQQNQNTFNQTYEVLRKNGTIVIFAEGTHSLIRNVRPLSKGFTRMAFGLMEKYPETKPVILPVALDFSAHRRSGSRVSITFGKVIPVDMPPSKSGLLTKSVEQALKDLAVYIPPENYESDLQRLIDNDVDLTSKSEVELFLTTGEQSRKVAPGSSLKNKLMKIFFFPLYWIWLAISPKIGDTVFDGTFKFLIGFFLAPVWFFILIWLALDSALGSWGLAFFVMAWISLYGNRNPQE